MEARERIRRQLDELFANAPQNRAAWELQEEFYRAAADFYNFRSARRIGRLFGAQYGWRRFGLAFLARKWLMSVFLMEIPMIFFRAGWREASRSSSGVTVSLVNFRSMLIRGGRRFCR